MPKKQDELQTVSRMLDLIGREVFEDGVLKEGEDYKNFENKFGMKRCGCVTRWHLGKLWGLNGKPAVEFEDTHTEYWEDGVISNKEIDPTGKRIPAIISMYNEVEEYWEDGKQLDVKYYKRQA